MRITYLKLVNYANIFAGLKQKVLEMDLSKSKRKIVLIMGENGSGKTSILSQLQPFPFTVGDSREGKGIILENEEGYKEIHYLVDGVKYKIKHFISPSGTVKSYISKDGEELNPNGNVRSFEETVETYLHMTKDKLQLMRLGTNSSTFIKMSSAKRKSFTSELLSEINVYSSLYKKMNDDFRNIRTLIKNVTSKMQSLNIQDIDGYRSSIGDIESYIQVTTKAREELMGQRSITLNKIEELGGFDQSLTYAARNTLESNIADIDRVLNRIDGLSVKELESRIRDVDKAIIEKGASITIDTSKLGDLLDRLDVVSYELSETTSKLQMLTSKGEVAELTVMLTDVEKEIKDLETKFAGFKPKASLEDFKRILDVYKELDRVVSISHEFDHKAIVNVIALFSQGLNVEKTLNKEYSDTVNKLNTAKSKLSAAQSGKGKEDAPNMVIFKDANCNCNCPFEAFFDEIMCNDKKDVGNIRDRVYSLEREIDLIDEKFAIMSNINLIKMTVEANKTLIERLPEGVMDFQQIIMSVANNLPIYDEEELTSYISLMENYDRLAELKTRRLDLREELSKLRASGDMITELNNKVIDLQKENDTISKSISEYNAKVEVLKAENTTLENRLEELKSSLEEAEKVDVLRENRAVAESELNTINRNLELLATLVPKAKQLNEAINDAEKSINTYEHRLQESKRRLVNFEELQNELQLLNERYDKIVLIRDAVSSTKGIPLIYIKIFMSDINSYINNLIRQVYGDSLEIDEFVINEKEFTIPYIKNGIKVPDISMISQGEETFVSLATTFSFLRRALGDYNIIAADELDGPLDDKKRQKFLDIIESELESMGIEQFFLISHNEVFNSYPVDCILTTEKDTSGFKNLSVVFRAA